MKRRAVCLALLPLLCRPAATRAEIARGTIKIGVLTDLSTEYAAFSGPGSVEAAKMAVEAWGGKLRGKQIEVISADHQEKPDVAAAIAGRWFDQDGVDMIVDVPGSSAALAVQDVARRHNKIFITTASAANSLSGKDCSPTGMQWIFSSYTNAQALGTGVVREGGDSWFFITVDNAGGISFEEDVGAIVRAAGGKVLGSARFPLTTTDFAPFIVQAQASKAKIVGLVSAGQSTVTALKQAAEFGLVGSGARIVLPFFYITDAHALGPQITQGLVIVEPFYWDLNDETRAFGQAFYSRMKFMPTSVHAGVNTAVTHFLKAVDASDSVDGAVVDKAMRSIPINDFMTKNGHVRVDGSVSRDRYIFQIKGPQEMKGEWDLYKPLRKLGGDEVLPPLASSDCPLARL